MFDQAEFGWGRVLRSHVVLEAGAVSDIPGHLEAVLGVDDGEGFGVSLLTAKDD